MKSILEFIKDHFVWMRPVNERRHNSVTSSLGGWAHTQNDPCSSLNNNHIWIHKPAKTYMETDLYIKMSIMKHHWRGLLTENTPPPPPPPSPPPPPPQGSNTWSSTVPNSIKNDMLSRKCYQCKYIAIHLNVWHLHNSALSSHGCRVVSNQPQLGSGKQQRKH